MSGLRRSRKVSILNSRWCVFILACGAFAGCVRQHATHQASAASPSDVRADALEIDGFQPSVLPASGTFLPDQFQTNTANVIVLCVVGPKASRRVRIVCGQVSTVDQSFTTSVIVGGPMNTEQAVRCLRRSALNWDGPFGIIFTYHDRPYRVVADKENALQTEVSAILVALRAQEVPFSEVIVGHQFSWRDYSLVH